MEVKHGQMQIIDIIDENAAEALETDSALKTFNSKYYKKVAKRTVSTVLTCWSFAGVMLS